MKPKTKWNDLADKIEFNGMILVNAMRHGSCAICDNATFWYDTSLMAFLCCEDCAVKKWLDVFNQKLGR